MCRNISEPVNAGGFHEGVGVKALGDGAGDEGLAFFGKAIQKRALLLDERIDTRRLLIQKSRSSALGFEGWESNTYCCKFVTREFDKCCSICYRIQFRCARFEQIVEIRPINFLAWYEAATALIESHWFVGNGHVANWSAG